MARRQKNYHDGGEQLVLISPDSPWSRPSELPDLRRHRRVALDRETCDLGLQRGLGPGWAFGAAGGFVCGTSIAWVQDGKIRSAYFPVRHPDTECFDPDQVRQWEIDHQRAGVRFVFQNAPYDIGWGATSGVPVPEQSNDTVCMANMIDEQRQSFELDALCATYGIPGKDETLMTEALAAYGWPTSHKERKKHIWRLPARYVGPYAEQDAAATLQLADLMDEEIDRQGVRVAYQLEMDLVPMVHEMRRRGIRVDLDAAARAQDVFRTRSREALRELSERLGQRVGVDEIRQNSWLDRTFTDLKIPFPREDGRGSFEAKWMRRSPHWLPQLACRAKSAEDAAEKFLGTYILGFAHSSSGSDSRIHASINQFRGEDGGTRTYRFSYSDPPLQQIPKRDEDKYLALLTRGVFLPEPGEWWMRADYSQQEYRLIVHFAERLGLTRADIAAQRYRDDLRTDYHVMVAELTGLDRDASKNCNFAKSYGAGKDKFAAMIGKSVDEAVRTMAQYDVEMPFVRELSDLCQKSAEQRGYVLLLDRARIHFDSWEPTWLSRDDKAKGWGSGGRIKMGDCSREEALRRAADPDHPWYRKRLRRAKCRKAMNAKIQGSAARQSKMSMRDCWRAGHVPLLQMHDELDFSVSERRQGDEITQIMRDVVKLNVPMLVDAEYGGNWGKAKCMWEDRGEPAE